MEYRKLNSREQTTNVTYRVSFFILLQRVANEKIKIIKSKQRLAIDILTCHVKVPSSLNNVILMMSENKS